MTTWKKILLPITIFIGGSVAVYAVATSKPKPSANLNGDQSPPKIQVQVKELQRETVSLSVTSQGTVKPRREIDLVAQVSGQVIKVEKNFVDGGFFQDNQLLIQIDDSDYQVSYLNAKSRLAEAKRRLAEEEGLSRQARREWRDLGNENANALYLRKPQLEAAKASLAFAEAEVKKAKLDLDRTKITVPFAGRIRQTQVDLGQFVTRGTRLAQVYDTSIAEIRLPLTERQAALVNLPLVNDSENTLNPAKVTLKGSVAGVQHEWIGKVTRTDAFIDQQSRMYYAIVEVADPLGINKQNAAPLLPGLFVTAEIEGKNITNVISLPRNAVFKQNKIYTLDGENKIERHTVEVLRKTQDKIWIKANEVENETRIVLEKQSLTTPGTTVDPIQPALPSQNNNPVEEVASAQIAKSADNALEKDE